MDKDKDKLDFADFIGIYISIVILITIAGLLRGC